MSESCIILTLVESFGLDKDLKVNTNNIMNTRILMNSMIESGYLQIPNNKIIKKIEDNRITKIDFEEKNKFFKEEFYKNIAVIALSITSYVYFTKLSNYLSRVNSLKIFRPLFIFNFCILPIGITLYYSHLDYNDKIEKMNSNIKY